MRRIGKIVLALCVVTMIHATSFAQTDIGLKTVGGHLGLVSPNISGMGSTLELGGVVGLGTLMPNLELQGNVDFWRKSESAGDVTSAFTDVSFGGTVNYLVDINNPNLVPYGSAGLALHILHSSVDMPSVDLGQYGSYGGSYSDSKTRLGLNLGGGVKYMMSPKLTLVGELKYRFVSNANQLVITVGAEVPI